MLSQGHMVAPLYHYTSQVVLSFGNSGSLEEWKWCHNVTVEADIHLRPLHSSILVTYKVFETLVCCLNGIWVHHDTITLAKLPPDLGIQVHLRSRKWCQSFMVEADIHHKPLHTSLDMYKVFETLVCCLKGIWLHPYTITRAKFSWVLGICQVYLRSGKTAITSWLRLTSTSDHFIHPY